MSVDSSPLLHSTQHSKPHSERDVLNILGSILKWNKKRNTKETQQGGCPSFKTVFWNENCKLCNYGEHVKRANSRKRKSSLFEDDLPPDKVRSIALASLDEAILRRQKGAAVKLQCARELVSRISQETTDQQVIDIVRKVHILFEEPADLPRGAFSFKVLTKLSWSHSWQNVIRIVFTYVYGFGTVMLTLFASTLLIEATILSGEAQLKSAQVVMFCLPLYMQIACLLIQSCLEICLDAFSDPPMSKFNAMILTSLCFLTERVMIPHWKVQDLVGFVVVVFSFVFGFYSGFPNIGLLIFLAGIGTLVNSALNNTEVYRAAPTHNVCRAVDVINLFCQLVPFVGMLFGLVVHSQDPDGRGIVGAMWRSCIQTTVLCMFLSCVVHLILKYWIHMSSFAGLPASGDKEDNPKCAHYGLNLMRVYNYQKLFKAHKIYLTTLTRRRWVFWLPKYEEGQENEEHPDNIKKFVHELLSEEPEFHGETLLDDDERVNHIEDIKALHRFWHPCWGLVLGLSHVVWIGILCVLDRCLLFSFFGQDCIGGAVLTPFGNYNIEPVVFAVVLLVVVTFSSTLLNKRAPGLLSRAYYVAIVVLFVISLVNMFGAANKHSGQNSTSMPSGIVANGKADHSCDNTKTDLEQNCGWQGARDKYDMCYRTWGAAELSAFDMSQLATLPYAGLRDTHDKELRLAFPTEAFPDINISVVNRTKYTDFPCFVTYEFAGRNGRKTYIVSYKGTSTAKDAWYDFALFGIVKTIQLIDIAVPVLKLLGVDQAQWYAATVHWAGTHDKEKVLWERAQEPVIKLQRESKEVIVTGHSLGGGVAQIVAGKLKVPALVFSSPGIVYSAGRFGLVQPANKLKKSLWNSTVVTKAHENIAMQWFMRQVTVVMPQYDIVPRVDRQAGNVQHIDCRLYSTDTGEIGLQGGWAGWMFSKLLSAGPCHSIGKTACELWRVCGDTRNRSVTCSNMSALPENSLGGFYYPDVTDDL